jgi:hypothetical protein
MVPEMQPPRLVAPALFGFAGAGICAVRGGEDCGCPAAGVPPAPEEGDAPPTAPVEPDTPLASCPGMVEE